MISVRRNNRVRKEKITTQKILAFFASLREHRLMKKRFIEESFPVKEVSAESAREKNIRQGHISTLHIWWEDGILKNRTRMTRITRIVADKK